jgi:hypothetical protein
MSDTSSHYEQVKRYYDTGAWSLARVSNAVGKWITENEYKDITRQEHE